MRGLTRLVFLLLPTVLLSCAQSQSRTEGDFAEPPMARVEPRETTAHGHTRFDDYHWLGEDRTPEVMAYLEAENAYTETVMADTRPLQERILGEILERMVGADVSMPYRLGDYYYYERLEVGGDYPIYARKKGSLDAEEEILLDVNELAPSEGFFDATEPLVSPAGDVLAFFTIRDPRGQGTIRFKDLTTGAMLDDEIVWATGIMEWANDNQTLLYVKPHPETFRWYRVYRHTLGTDPSDDVLIYEEPDDGLRLWIGKSRSGRFLFIHDVLGRETRYLEADEPRGTPRVFLPREEGHSYDVDHFGDHFIVKTDDVGENGRIVRTPVARTGRENWEIVIPYRDAVPLLRVQTFRDYLVWEERANGLRQICIRTWSGEEGHCIDFGEPAYLAYLGFNNHEFDTDVFRYRYSSFTTPPSVYEYNMRTRERVLLKHEEVEGGYSGEDYVSHRLYAPSRDGTQIPVSLVYRRGLRRDGNNPLLLSAYGAYGSTTDPSFDPARPCLLDRGFIFAIAHVRGGGALGPLWRIQGEGLNKKNTMFDYIDVAQYLIEQGYTSPGRLFGTGRSAGGMLMGAVANMRPDLFRGLIAEVPAVDALDPRHGFGDPGDEETYRYILSYSPYENVEAQAYPNILATAGLLDSRVPYWQPAKWVAKLRALKTDRNLVLLRTSMETGHSGPPTARDRWREVAFQYAFLLHLAGIQN